MIKIIYKNKLKLHAYCIQRCPCAGVCVTKVLLNGKPKIKRQRCNSINFVADPAGILQTFLIL